MRSRNCLEWSDQDWLDFHRENWERLDPEVRAEAVAFLQRELGASVLRELRNRIIENPAHWIGGRDNVECWWCEGTGNVMIEDSAVVCRMCQGVGRSHELPMHHGFGTRIRNLLRDGGFSEELLGVGNLDDYYIPLLEAAAGVPPS